MSAKRYDLSWADFQPTRLQAVRRKIVEEHPATATKLRAASESQLQELKERIAAAAGDERALRKLAHELTASQLRGLAVQIGPWEELRGAVATILRERQRRSFLPHLWSTWQRYPQAAEVRALLQELASEHGWSTVAPGYEEAVTEWLGSGDPPAAIQRWLDGQGLSYSDLSDLADLPLSQDTPLDRAVRAAVMTQGSEAQLRAEGPDRLTGWFTQLTSEQRMQFGVHYLETLDAGRWEPPILEFLRKTYGPPPDGREAFWRRVPDEIRRAFHRWFIERNLREALGSGTERHEYWLTRAEDILDVELGRAGRVEYAALYFKTFGVIEFFKTGNAAYFYPLDKLEEILAIDARKPADLKDPDARSLASSQNRLIHRRGWQSTADRMVRKWKRKTA